ncbi:MAG: hypothetical protein KIC47_03225 [Clostridium sp.]|nr:hypothetical protein [Clostridium sp.]MBS5949323.1 hypothetical protein [Clostridium sp.]
MEIVENNQKLGAGIITMSVLYLIGQAFTMLSVLINIVMKDEIARMLAEAGTISEITTAQLGVTLVISLILTVSIILILFKKYIGAYIFIGIEVLSLLFSIITGAFTLFSIIGLVFPGLMIFFLYKKKEIYFARIKF